LLEGFEVEIFLILTAEGKFVARLSWPVVRRLRPGRPVLFFITTKRQKMLERSR
jgi:hypothetical protein